MMIPVDNRLAQPPNDLWHDIATNAPPTCEQVAFTDADKQFVWIGSLSCEGATLPVLPATGQIAGSVPPAFWSAIADQT